jgi:Tfp pilus assembly protein PilO
MAENKSKQVKSVKPKEENSKRSNGKNGDQEIKMEKKAKNLKDPHKRFMSKVIFFTVSNLISVVLLFLFLGDLPKKALELKTLINAGAKAEASSKINIADLEIQSNQEHADVLSDVFPTEEELINFVKDIESLEAEGLVKNFSFANTKPVRDRTQILGIPIVIEMSGTWSQINTGLERIYKSIYLLRAITVTAQPTGEEGIIDFKFGGFLYVDDSFEKN